MHPASPLPSGFAGAGGRRRCSAWEWNDHSLHLTPWRPSRPGKRSPAGYCEHALGTVGYLVANSTTVGAGLVNLHRITHLPAAGVPAIRKAGEGTKPKWNLHLVSTGAPPGTLVARHLKK